MSTALTPDLLHRGCPTDHVPFDTTADADGSDDIVGQDRAIEAARFGLGMTGDGYNLFALGPPGVGKQTLLRRFLDREAGARPTPTDWCYVSDFDDPRRPRALELPAGQGRALRADLERAVTELMAAMPAAFDSDEYRTRKRTLVNDFGERQRAAFADVQERAKTRSVAVARTETGVAIAPLHEGRTLEPAEFHELPVADRTRLEAALEATGEDLNRLFEQFHEWGHHQLAALEELARDTAAAVAHRIVGGVVDGYAGLPDVVDYLNAVERDVVASVRDFLSRPDEGVEAVLRRTLQREVGDGAFRRYKVNLVIDNADARGAPVVFEDHPTQPNLLGRLEHAAQFGALVTDFTMLRPGALHRARGGYLLVDARKVLENPLAWDALKRAIRTRELRIELPFASLGLANAVSLEPVAIPLGATKVVLFGDRRLYYLLAELDPDFLEQFKVMVDFEDTIERDPESEARYAQLIAGLVTREGLRHFDRGAVARVIEHAARLADDSSSLSVHLRPVVDLLREADHWARRAEHELVGAADVEAALDGQRHRAGRIRERLLEALRKRRVLVSTSGAAVGQINGLSVLTLGAHRVGQPTRITARVRVGKGEVIDIEREVDLGGPIHSKGVLILGGFVGARYTPGVPLALSASLVFEQSYTGVEGDSASLAELCGLLSALADLPIAQSLAVTGSVNQHGEVQPVGGVNDKIEGFFDACAQRGLTGAEGVLIPRANVQDLMLRRDVVEAVEAGRFAIHAVTSVDEAIALLTGQPAGERHEDGRFADGTVNARVEARLLRFAADARRAAGGD